MAGSGDSGAHLVAGALFVAAVFAGCGGSSKTSGESDDDQGGNAGNSASGRGGGRAGGTGGTGAGGASIGGSQIEPPRGGAGAVGPLDPPGPSFCGGLPCDPPLACCMATGECFDPRTDGEDACAPPGPDNDPEGRRPCSSNAHCEAGQFCMLDGQLCVGTGHCQPIGNCGECGGGGDPNAPDNPCRICACDGNTYPNVQTACRAGVNGPLASGAGCGETGMEGGGGSSTSGPREFVPCGHDGQCASGSFCCTLNARCYVESNRDICVPPPPGTRIACKTNLDCGDYEYCVGEGCDGPGGCVNKGSYVSGDCGVTLEPVCGCDGTTYTSAPCADLQGVRIDYVGECGGE